MGRMTRDSCSDSDFQDLRETDTAARQPSCCEDHTTPKDRARRTRRRGTARPTVVAQASDCVVAKIRSMKQPVTRETYALLAFWRPYSKLTFEEKQDVRDAVYDANIQ